MLLLTNVNKKGAPKQPGGHECGYYVMRYMRDIIDDETLGFPTKVSIIVCRKFDFNIISFSG
jgi:Ulp1 family protease